MPTKYTAPAHHADIASAKEALESNGFIVTVVNDAEEAKQEAIRLVPEGAEVFTATSDTLNELGLTEHFNTDEKYRSVRMQIARLQESNASKIEVRRLGSATEYAIGSVQAITQDGQVLLASATGSQIPNYAYGANNVIWLVGAQKIVKTLNDAFHRIETHAYPLEDARAKEAYGIPSSINKILVYRKEQSKRVHIILINEPLGY